MAGRILIADPTATNRIILKVRLAAARYEALQAATGADVLALARAERPDLVIVNAHLPDATGAEICAALKHEPRTRAIPVLILDALGRREDRLAALRAGADDVLTKPLDESTLLALMRNLMRTRATFDELARRQDTVAELGFAEAAPGFARPARVAVIAPTSETGLSWRRELGAALGLRVRQLSRAQALDTMSPHEVPDAFILAADLAAQGDGLRLISELRSRTATRHAVIVIPDEEAEAGTVPMALDLGANAVVLGRFDAAEIAARLDTLLARKLETDALRESVDARLHLATIDPLTGLFNRRYAEAYLKNVAAEAVHSGKPFALMLLDLDRFKAVNDTHGHLVGDEVLVETARRLRANLREIDLLTRHGGEEFLVAMPETDLAAASKAAERLRRVIGEVPMRSPSQGKDVSVTVSIGVALCTGTKERLSLSAMIEQADAALYASKNDGRNLVTFARGAAA